MNNFTIEETNLISIYNEGSKQELIHQMTAALPFMDADMQEFANHVINKIESLTETEFLELSVYAADEI